MSDEKEKKSLITQGITSVMNASYQQLSDMGDIEKLVRDNDNDVDKLIRAQAMKAGAVGFATGLPGLAAIAATLPANFAGTLYNQIRMIAGIAYIRGYDLQHDSVKTMVFCCLLGESATKMAKEMATASMKLVIQKVAAKLGEKLAGQVVGKMVPLLGGVIGAAVDSTSTYAIGKVANKIFSERKGPKDGNIMLADVIETDAVIMGEKEANKNIK